MLFASAIEVINTLAAAKSAGRLKQELKKYTQPALRILDERGYLPIDKAGPTSSSKSSRCATNRARS